MTFLADYQDDQHSGDLRMSYLEYALQVISGRTQAEAPTQMVTRPSFVWPEAVQEPYQASVPQELAVKKPARITRSGRGCGQTSARWLVTPQVEWSHAPPLSA